jgi:dynamin-like GTPase MGM1, mitochondrial
MNDRISEMPRAEKDDSYWLRKLDATTGTLTRVGVGRISTEAVERELQRQVDGIISEGSFQHSPMAQSRINDAAQEIISSRKGKTTDQVENSVKPYKMGVEIDDREWNAARERIVLSLEKEVKMCEESFANLQRGMGGRRRMTQVMQAIKSVDEGGSGGGFADDMLRAGNISPDFLIW